MKRTVRLALIALVLCCLAWPFVGLERLIGDHEVGVVWTPFLKHRPSLQMLYVNPAQEGLDSLPFESLPPQQHAEFLAYCRVRFGLTSGQKCATALADRRI